MPDISVIILTYNEEIHIERCILSVLQVVSKIFIVDSFSTDETAKIAKKYDIEVVQRKFINHAEQFQWAIDNLPIESKWVMRLDADEYLEPSLQDEIKVILPSISQGVDGVYINRKHFFYDKWIKHGGRYPLKLLRIWRRGKGKIEQRWMDEHIVLHDDAETVLLQGGLVDDNLKGISYFIDKHNSYATREAIDVLNNKYNLYKKDITIMMNSNSQVKRKRILKDKIYSRLPVGIRPVLYFNYRYFIQLGVLDGWRGFIYHFMQGLWYRLLVDVKIYEIDNKCNGDMDKMKLMLKEEYGIDVNF